MAHARIPWFGRIRERQYYLQGRGVSVHEMQRINWAIRSPLVFRGLVVRTNTCAIRTHPSGCMTLPKDIPGEWGQGLPMKRLEQWRGCSVNTMDWTSWWCRGERGRTWWGARRGWCLRCTGKNSMPTTTREILFVHQPSGGVSMWNLSLFQLCSHKSIYIQIVQPTHAIRATQHEHVGPVR